MSAYPIFVLYTGGTFGCAGQPLQPLDGITITDHLLPLLQTRGFAQIKFDALEQPIDSTQLTPNHWLELLKMIVAQYRQGVRHMVIIHGTDTLAYTAAFLAESLAGTDLHLMVTGSQHPLLDAQTLTPNPNSDALDNLCLALGQVQQQMGVFVSFAGETWPAQTVQKIHSQDLAAFCGHWRAGYPAVSFHRCRPATQQAWCEDIAQKLTDEGWQQRFLTTHIAVCYALPQPTEQLAAQLAHYATLAEQHLLDGLILLGYGTGNFPDHPHITAQLARLAAQSVLMVAATQVPFGGTDERYATGAWMKTFGVLPAARLTLPAIYARLFWLCQSLPSFERRHTTWLKYSQDTRTLKSF